MANPKKALARKRNRPQVKDRKNFPYVVFQVDRKVKERLMRKIKGKRSMSSYVEDLIVRDLRRAA